MTEFIRREFQVQEPNKAAVIRQDAPAPRPQTAAGGILYIIGLQGSGKSALAAGLAEALGCPAHTLPQDGADEALTRILASGPAAPAVIEVPHKLLSAEAFRARLQATGRLLYLMASVEAIAERQAEEPEERAQLRERLGRQRTSYEPLFMQTLHLIAPADGPLAEVLADVLERVRM